MGNFIAECVCVSSAYVNPVSFKVVKASYLDSRVQEELKLV